jgi:hypothetical protein
MPYLEGYEEEYGPSFKPWDKSDLASAVRSITATMPYYDIALVVRFLFSFTPIS